MTHKKYIYIYIHTENHKIREWEGGSTDIGILGKANHKIRRDTQT